MDSLEFLRDCCKGSRIQDLDLGLSKRCLKKWPAKPAIFVSKVIFVQNYVCLSFVLGYCLSSIVFCCTCWQTHLDFKGENASCDEHFVFILHYRVIVRETGELRIQEPMCLEPSS